MSEKITLLLTIALLSFGLTACDNSSSSSTLAVTPDELLDSDNDGLTDTAENDGWQVTLFLANGEVKYIDVTSDPNNPDTDSDGMTDAQEKSALTDPRNPDTDNDQLSDEQELKEIYSSPYRQDTDGDGLVDGIEFNFHHTSPILSDTDGDQISDSDEVIIETRNARVADLPSPTIEVGEINLQLDVRFTETSSRETRQLETRNISSTLTQSDRQEYSNTNSNTQEAMAKFSVGTEYEVKGSIFDAGGTWKTNIGFETGWTGSWTSSSTKTSAQETQRAYEESLSTDVETTEGATVTRSVDGARMQATISIKNAGEIAYSIHNLQVTAFIQDPEDPTRLKPVATLLPDNEPEDGFHLGPLVPERGPFIFSNDLIFPQLVENLMKNPRGLVFIISNYDITDELGRNFVFSAQEVVERTAALVIDFGSFDSDGDKEGDLTEYHRIATSSGRTMEGSDRRIVFDSNGRHVGITLRDALEAIGLTHYNEETTPASSLSEQEILTSYSTIIDDAGVERIFRVRKAAVETGVPKAWEVLTATGIDQTVGLDDFILMAQDDIKLSFVQDIDQDRMVASLEFVYGCSDILADTDADGLDDRMEALLGWVVHTSAGSRQVFSRCSSADTDRDGLTDAQESGAAIDCDMDGSTDATWVTDPSVSDTDDDGISDRDEICGYDVTLINSGTTIRVTTDPTNRDTDGDTAADGVERRLGGNPTDPADINQFGDSDGDGLVNYQETEGWDIQVYGVSTTPTVCDSVCDEAVPVTVHVTSDPFSADTDGDGLLDGFEKTIKTNPGKPDTDSDGLSDFQEVRGFVLRDQGLIVLDPADADTDNDKRSDGDEAELDDIIARRWIVRVVGETPYRVFSDPLKADADFDTLVDGDEYSYTAPSNTSVVLRSDPTLANTDGDRRDDALEATLGLNPLVADVKVTVFFRDILVTQKGEPHSPQGGALALADCSIYASDCGDAEIYFDLNVRLPDDSTATGMMNTPVTISNQDDIKTYLPDCAWLSSVNIWESSNTPCQHSRQWGIQMSNNDVLDLFEYDIPSSLYSISFSLTESQRFSVEGRIGEYDDPAPNWIKLGGLTGLQDNNGTRTVFEGKTVVTQTIEDFTFEFSKPDWGTDSLGFPKPGSGEMRFFYIVE